MRECIIPPTEVYMITEDGRHWFEPEYDGYGEFGGQDIYALIAELNGYKPGMSPKKKEKRGFIVDDEEFQRKREFGIRLSFNSGITNGKFTYKYGKDFTNWDEKVHDGKSPNELVEKGWRETDFKEWDDAAKAGIKLPKLVEKLPSKKNWKQVWDSIPYPLHDPDQGAPPDEDEDEDDSGC